MTDARPFGGPRVGRDGHLRLRFARADGHTVLAAWRSTLPLQVLAPLALDDPAATVSVLNPTGGLAGGDRLLIDVHVAAGAHACVTTPSATKVYRTAGAAARQDVRCRVAPGAILEFVPDHAIPFPGSSFRQAIDVELAPGARLILVDAFAAGRVARDEAWRFARLESAVSVHDGRGWLFHDRFVLEGAPGWSALGRCEGAPYFATVLAVGGDGARVRAALAVAGGDGADVAAAALPRGGAVARVLARSAPALTAALDGLWTAARRALLDLGPLALRKA